jgi:PhzF family phenazine biosynthesis protein
MRLYQLDAFTDRPFAGNPAAVVPLAEWLPDTLMQQIAEENNLAETAFYVPVEGSDRHFHLRWFTPTVEVDLCGHATLATACVVFNLEQKPDTDKITFESRSGPLHVSHSADGWLTLDFPTDTLQKAAIIPPALLSGMTERPTEVYKGRLDFMLVYDTQAQVEALAPDFRELATVPARGIIATAPADADSDVDFISRFFSPQTGGDEDPVTGSAHTSLIPYWAARLGKTELTARQVSERGGYLRCQLCDDGSRVNISGQVQLYLTGDLRL